MGDAHWREDEGRRREVDFGVSTVAFEAAGLKKHAGGGVRILKHDILTGVGGG